MNIDELIIQHTTEEPLNTTEEPLNTTEEPLDLTKYTLKSTKLQGLKKIILDPPITIFINAVLFSLSEKYRQLDNNNKNRIIQLLYTQMNLPARKDKRNLDRPFIDKDFTLIINLLNQLLTLKLLIICINTTWIGVLATYEPATKLYSSSEDIDTVIIIEQTSNGFNSILIDDKFYLTKDEYESYDFKIQSNDEFSIMSFNVYYNTCAQLNSINNNLETLQPNIICTQEANPLKLNIFDGYTYIDKYGEDKSREIVAVYQLDNQSKINNIEKIISTLKLSREYYRYGIIFNYNNIKIANLHLAGGRGYDTVLFTRFEKLLTFKLELLNKILKTQPDIILGDFNSVYNIDDIKKLESQIKYFRSIKKNDLTDEEIDKIKKYNKLPYDTLLTEGYIYADPGNELYTSHLGETIVDCIWYKKDKLELAGCKIIELSKETPINTETCISDHNPVIAKFKIKQPQQYKNKYIKYKNKYLKQKNKIL